MKKILLLLVIIALLVSALLLLNKRKQSIQETPLPVPMTIQVKVSTADTAHLQQTSPFLAQLAAAEVAEISSKLSGRIKNILVKENQTVKEGDLLLQIDDQEIISGIKTQQMNIKALKKELQYVQSLHERNRSLFKSGGLAREKFEASAVTLAAKQAALEATRQKIIELEIQLSYVNIKAPFDGITGTIYSRKGSLASPGKTLLSINSLQQKLTFSYVPGTVTVETGQDVLIKGKKNAQISNLYSDADNGLAVAEVRVQSPLPLPNKSYITIELLTFSGSGCRVPLNALIITDKGTQLMLYKNAQFSPLPVTIIADNKDYALIKPCPSDPIALASAAKLSELPGHGKVLINRSKPGE